MAAVAKCGLIGVGHNAILAGRFPFWYLACK
jgi:hypothetical protein